MTFFVRLGNVYRATPYSAVDIQEKIPVGTYAAKVDDNGFFLEKIADFEMPEKLYGDCTKNTDRMINTFWERPLSTGIFLEGEKGSGKTLLGKNISVELLKQDVPTIVVNNPLFGDGFNTFIQSINQPAVIFFDEFEKVYDADEGQQERILTLFDGVYPTKKLFIVTCNESYRVDKNMKNRPGRMYYMLQFKGLDEDFIREYATENLNDKTQVDSILTVSTLFGSFNFDMLKALVEEMNRYGETAQQAIKLLNTKPNADKSVFEMRLFVGGDELALQHPQNQWHGNPLSQAVIAQRFEKDTLGTNSWVQYSFAPEDLKKVDGGEGTFMYINDSDQRLVLSRKKYEVVDWTKFVAN